MKIQFKYGKVFKPMRLDSNNYGGDVMVSESNEILSNKRRDLEFYMGDVILSKTDNRTDD